MPERKQQRHLLGGTKSADGGRVKDASREAVAPFAPSLTRPPAADTLKPAKSRLTTKTVAHASPVTFIPSTACAAANRAIGTRKGEHDT